MVTVDFAKGLGVTLMAGIGLLVGFRIQSMVQERTEVRGWWERWKRADARCTTPRHPALFEPPCALRTTLRSSPSLHTRHSLVPPPRSAILRSAWSASTLGEWQRARAQEEGLLAVVGAQQQWMVTQLVDEAGGCVGRHIHTCCSGKRLERWRVAIAASGDGRRRQRGCAARGMHGTVHHHLLCALYCDDGAAHISSES